MDHASNNFIGRSREIEFINQCLALPETTKIICFDGIGGIGKSALLSKIAAPGTQNTNLRIPEIINFAEPKNRIRRYFRSSIAENIAPRTFVNYLQAVKEYQHMELANVSPERLNAELDTIDRSFVNSFNSKIASHFRTLLRFDSIEAILDDPLWTDYLFTQLGKLKNCVICFSGKQIEPLQKNLEKYFPGSNIHILKLEPFSQKESHDFFKTWSSSSKTSKETEAKLHLLTNGKPILLRLAIDWVNRNVPLPDEMNKTLLELQSATLAKLDGLRKNFETALVLEVLSFLKPQDRAILDIACLDDYIHAELLAHLLRISQVRAQKIMREFSKLMFFKTGVNYTLMLHDEMRRLLKNYAWPKFDPFGNQCRKTHAQIAEYFGIHAAVLLKTIRKDQTRLHRAHINGDRTTELALQNQQLSGEMRYWENRVTELKHMLKSDIKKGMRVFQKCADQAADEFGHEYRQPLFNEMQPYLGHLTKSQKYEYDIRNAKFDFDKGDYQKAHIQLEKSLHTGKHSTQHQIQLLVQIGNTLIRMGEAQKALKYFHNALDICKQKKTQKCLGLLYNELGWTNRLLGNWDEAISHYELALSYAQKASQQSEIADILNNIGFIYHLKGDFSSAQVCCEAALNIREKLNFVHDQGISHNTLSILYREQGAYEQALQHSNTALTIFSDRDDIEWQGKAYRERGVLRWLVGQTDAAQNDLRKSLNIFEKHGFQHELPNTYFRFALLLKTQSTRSQDIPFPERRMLLEKAEDYLKKCHEFGIKIADSSHILMSLMQLTELLYFATSKNYGNRSHDIKQFYGSIRCYTKTNHSQYPLALGHAEKIMGAIELDAGRYDQALHFFKNSYAGIALAGTQKQDLLDKTTIDFLGSNIAKLKPITAVRWCNELIQTWQQNNLTGRYPEFITHLKIWRMQAKLNKGKT